MQLRAPNIGDSFSDPATGSSYVGEAGATIDVSNADVQTAISRGWGLSGVQSWKPAGNRTLTYTGSLAQGATSGTLSGSWGGPTGRYLQTTSTGEQCLALLVASSTAVVFTAYPAPSTGGTYGSAYALKTAATSSVTIAGTPPIVGAANAYSVSASISAAGTAVLGGAQTTSGVGTPDVPRNVVGAWTTSSTVTVVGTDYYGKAQTEAQTGTAFTGKKAFATVTSITSSASVTGATFGTGNALGLPFCVRSGEFTAPMFNDAADAGTFVEADFTDPATSSTGDVRGTYTPAGTLNSNKFLTMHYRVADTFSVVGQLGITPA